MLVHLLAADETVAHKVGVIGFALLIPTLGVVLLIAGLRRSRAAGRAAAPPQWPPPGSVGAPPPGRPPTQPPASRGTAMIVIGALLLLFSVAGALGRIAPRNAPDQPDRSPGLAVGDCITESQIKAGNMATEPVGCDQEHAVYKLAYRGEGPTATCPDGKRENGSYPLLYNDSLIYCFILNVTEGQCFVMDRAEGRFAEVDCTDPTANIKIGAILHGVDDLSACPGGPSGVTFPEPKVTFCTLAPHQPPMR